MFVVLAESLADDLLFGENAEESLGAIECAVQARREGRHVLFSKREVLDKIIQRATPHLSKRTLVVLQHVRSSLPQLGTLYSTVQQRLSIGGPSEVTRVEKVDGVDTIVIPSCLANKGQILNEPVFLTEHLVDSEFLFFLENAYRKIFFPLHAHIRLVYEPILGGGNSVADQLDAIKAKGARLCLVIVDSDRKFRDDGVGDTARRVIDSDRDSPSALTKSFVLPVRTAENLCSVNLLTDAFSADHERAEVLRRVERLQALENDAVWDFVPIKTGLKFCQLSSGTQGHNQYWLDATQRLGLAEGFVCSITAGLQCGQAICSNYVTPPLGGQVLAVVVSYLKGSDAKASLFEPQVSGDN